MCHTLDTGALVAPISVGTLRVSMAFVKTIKALVYIVTLCAVSEVTLKGV